MNVLILIAGLIACASAVTLLARGMSASRLRTSETIGQIHEYGYTLPPDTGTQPKAGPLTRMFEGLVEALGSALSEHGRASGVRQDLLAAAMYNTSVARFMGYRAVAALGLTGVWLWICVAANVPTLLLVVGTALALFSGWWLPLSTVRRRAAERFERIEREMPDLMDLLVVTVESGMSFNASLKIATERLEGPLGDE